MIKNECFLFRNPCPNRSGACLCAEPDGDSCPLYRWFKAKVIEIEKDIVTVVRCKDCKHYLKLTFLSECTKHDLAVEPNDYCSDGERREEDVECKDVVLR